MEMATKEQKKEILRNCGYDRNVKEELVQMATNDNSKISLNDLSQEQASYIIARQTGKHVDKLPVENWAYFDKNNARHKLILSLLRQLQWTIPHPTYGTVPDLDRLSDWLKSDKSPVNKPLKKMDPNETEKIIGALSGMIGKRYGAKPKSKKK